MKYRADRRLNRPYTSYFRRHTRSGKHCQSPWPAPRCRFVWYRAAYHKLLFLASTSWTVRGDWVRERFWLIFNRREERKMGSRIDTQSDDAEKAVRDIRRATRRHFSAEDKVRIVIAGLRGEDSVAELCRKEGINQNLYYRWSTEFLEAGKKRPAGDTAREATSDEVKGLRAEACWRTACSKKACWPMGSPIHEVRGGREVEDQLAGRAVVVAGAPWSSPASRVPPSTADTTAIAPVTPRALRIARRRRGGCGTSSRPQSPRRCSSWRSKSRSCHPGSWRCRSSTSRSTSSRKPRFTAAQGTRSDH